MGIVGVMHGVAGAISGLLPVKHEQSKPLKHERTRSRRIRPATARPRKGRKTRRGAGLRTVRWSSLGVRVRLIEIVEGPVEVVEEPPSLALVVQPILPVCPACGLQGPEQVLAEHFLLSPTHKNGRILQEPVSDKRIEEGPIAISQNDSRDGLRNLLQILIPPRPFGRRLEQRTVNPVSELSRPFDLDDPLRPNRLARDL